MAAVCAARCFRAIARPLHSASQVHLRKPFMRITNARFVHSTKYLSTVIKYTESHEWISVDGDIGSIGVTDHAQAELGDIVYCELPEIGIELSKDDTFGSIESVKATSDLVSPVSGTVTDVNNALTDSPETINQDPHGEGWLIKMKLSNLDELNDLMEEAAYEKFVKEAEDH